MLRYSYKTELKKYQVKKFALERDLFINSENDRARLKLEECEKQIKWLKERIVSGKDPGVKII